MELEKARDLIYSKKILLAAALINLGGTLFGFYYYAEQLAATSIPLWIFVPDSPLATLAAALVFYLHSRDRENSLIEAFAFFGNLKYGVWTVFVLLYMYHGFMQIHPLPLYVFLVVSHVLMFLQAFVILDFADFGWKPLALVSGWFLLNDFMDYSLGIHSALPEVVGFSSPVAWVAVAGTVAAVLIVYFTEIR